MNNMTREHENTRKKSAAVPLSPPTAVGANPRLRGEKPHKLRSGPCPHRTTYM